MRKDRVTADKIPKMIAEYASVTYGFIRLIDRYRS